MKKSVVIALIERKFRPDLKEGQAHDLAEFLYITQWWPRDQKAFDEIPARVWREGIGMVQAGWEPLQIEIME